MFASCITISQMVFAILDQVLAAAFEFVASDLQLDALAVVMMHNRALLAAGKLDFG
jgi:hypothetical protein